MTRRRIDSFETIPAWRPLAVAVLVVLAGGLIVVTAGGVAASAESTTAETPDGATVIDSCTSIDYSGTYVLGDDVEPTDPSQWEAQTACITINASGVTLDGAGHTIDGYSVSEHGEDVSSTYGIQVINRTHPGFDRENPDGWLDGVSIENVTLDHWHESVRATGISGLTIEDVDSRYGYLDAHETATDVRIRHGSNIEIRNVDATEGQVGRTIRIADVDGTTVENVTVQREQFYGESPVIGVVDSPNAEITGVTIDDSEASSYPSTTTIELAAIELVNAPDSVVTDNVVEGVRGDDWVGYGIYYDEWSNDNAHLADNEMTDVDVGIAVTNADGATVTRNAVEGGVGIEVTWSDDATITDNEVTYSEGEGTGIRVTDADGPVVTGNVVDGEAWTGLELYNVAPVAVEHNELTVRSTGINVETDGDDEVGTPAFEIADNEIDGGDVSIVSRPNVTITGMTIADGRIEVDSNALGGPDPENVHIEDVEIVGYPGWGGSLLVTDATDVSVVNVTSIDGVQTALELEASSDVSIEGFTATGHSGDDDFAFVYLEETENVAIDGLDISDNPATVRSGWGFDRGVLSIRGADSVEVSNLTALGNDLRVPALFVSSSSNVAFVDASVSATGDVLEARGDSEAIVGENVTMAVDTPTETTVSFEAEAVVLGDVLSPPDEPDVTPIDRYVSVERLGAAEPILDLDIHYDDEDVGAVDESTLELREEWGDGAWTPVDGSTVDDEAQTISATLSESLNATDETISVGAFGEEDQTDADIQVVDAALNESEIEVNDEVTITAEVENVGDEPGEHVVELVIDDVVVDDEPVELEPGETEEIAFAHTFDEAGTFDVKVDDVEAGTVTVEAGDIEWGSIQLSVTNASDEPIGGAAVWIVPPGEPASGEPNGLTDEDGVFEDDRPASTWDVVVAAEGYETERIEDVEIVAEELTTVDVELQSAVTVIDASLSETDVEAGEAVTITAEVENAGDAAGTHTVELEIDGTVVAETTVELNPGETEEIAFSHTFDDAGDFDVRVDGVETGTVTVSEADEPSPSPSPSPPDDTDETTDGDDQTADEPTDDETDDGQPEDESAGDETTADGDPTEDDSPDGDETVGGGDDSSDDQGDDSIPGLGIVAAVVAVLAVAVQRINHRVD